MLDPDLKVDAIFKKNLKILATIHMGYNSNKEMVTQKYIKLIADPEIIDNSQFWLVISCFVHS